MILKCWTLNWDLGSNPPPSTFTGWWSIDVGMKLWGGGRNPWLCMVWPGVWRFSMACSLCGPCSTDVLLRVSLHLVPQRRAAPLLRVAFSSSSVHFNSLGHHWMTLTDDPMTWEWYRGVQHWMRFGFPPWAQFSCGHSHCGFIRHQWCQNDLSDILVPLTLPQEGYIGVHSSSSTSTSSTSADFQMMPEWVMISI